MNLFRAENLRKICFLDAPLHKVSSSSLLIYQVSIFFLLSCLLKPSLPDPDAIGISFDSGKNSDHDVNEDLDPRCCAEVVEGELGELPRVGVGRGRRRNCRC